MKNTKKALTKYYQACGYGELAEVLTLGAIDELESISEQEVDKGETLLSIDVRCKLDEKILGFQNEDCSLEALKEIDDALERYADEWRELECDRF